MLTLFLLVLVIFCVLSALAIRHYAPPKSSRKKMSHRNRKAIDKNYQPLDKQTQSVVTALAFFFVFLINFSNNGFRLLPTYQMPDNSPVPALQDNGPTPDGTTSLTVINAVPRPFVFAIQQEKQKQNFEMDSCQNCKIYANSSEVPENVCKLGTTTTIAAAPGDNRVYWYYKNASINPISANWKISPGRRYSICIIVDLSKGRANWDSK